MKYKNIKKVGLAIIAFEGTEHLYNIIYSIRESVDYVSIGLQRVSYHGDRISNVDLNEIFRLRDEDHLVDNIVEIELDTSEEARKQETKKRNILIQDAEDHGCSHCIVIDSDEYYTKKSFDYALSEIDKHDYEITYCQYCNYAIDYEHLLVYPFSQGMYVPFVSKVKYRCDYDGKSFNLPRDPTRVLSRPYDRIDKARTKDGQIVDLPHYTVENHIFEWKEIKMHHLSWLRANIRKKLENWSSKKVFENYENLIDQAVESYENFDQSQDTGKLKMLFNTPGNTVDVVKLPKQFIHPVCDYKTRLRPAKDYKRLLVLSMSADMEPFDTLERVSNETWRNIDHEKYPNVDVVFWTYTDAKAGEETHIDEDNHIIYIKKAELPGYSNILRTYSKSIEAFYIIRDKLKIKFDYMIRTNNSTWLNIPLINEFLATVDDDSMLYAGFLCSAFWSAFNIYMGGQLMILSKRNVDVMLSLSGSVKDAMRAEEKIISHDDNMFCGLFNDRFIKIGVPAQKYYHSLGGIIITDKDFKEDDIDFTLPMYQVKTKGVDNEGRAMYDSEKMRKMDALWRKCNADIDELRKKMIEKTYDKYINVISPNKTEYFSYSDEQREEFCDFAKNRVKREEAIPQILKLHNANYTGPCSIIIK